MVVLGRKEYGGQATEVPLQCTAFSQGPREGWQTLEEDFKVLAGQGAVDPEHVEGFSQGPEAAEQTDPAAA